MKLVSYRHHCPCEVSGTYLQRVFSGETLVAVATRERLDGKMDPLMPLQVVVSIEALWALVAAEWPIILLDLGLRVTVHLLLHLCRRVTAVKAAGDHAVRHAANHLQLAARVVDVGQYGSWERVLVLSAVRGRL